MVSFDTTREEAEAIGQIVERASGMLKDLGREDIDLTSLNMDITACVANGCRLRLNELLEADDFNFIHDVFGINRHMDRKTGQLMNCFVPRFAR